MPGRAEPRRPSSRRVDHFAHSHYPPQAPAKSLHFQPQGFCKAELAPSTWKYGRATSPKATEGGMYG